MKALPRHLVARVVSAFCLGGTLLIAPSTYADLLAYEGFDYTAGTSLAGQSGGLGFATAWGTSAGVATMADPGFGYANLITSGGRLSVAGDTSGSLSIFRDLSTAQGTDGTTVWVSFLGQDTTTPSATFGPGGAPSMLRPINFSLFNGTSERLALGEGTRNSGVSLPDTDVWGLVERGGVNNAGTVWSTAPLADLTFVVVRIDYGAADADTAYMWVNPALGAEPSTASATISTTFTDMSFNRIRPFAGNPTTQSENVGASGFLDEIRIGATWADVTPVPEPGVLGLGALGLMGLIFAWRFRCVR